MEPSRGVTLTQKNPRQIEQAVFQARKDLFLRLYSPIEGGLEQFVFEFISWRNYYSYKDGIRKLMTNYLKLKK